MNPLLILYLNFVRGPQLLAAQKKKEEEEKALKAEKNDGKPKEEQQKPELVKKPVQLVSCKKCDGQSPSDEVDENFGLCNRCASNPWSLITPFVVFQLGGIIIALAVFVYRLMNGLPLI